MGVISEIGVNIIKLAEWLLDFTGGKKGRVLITTERSVRRDRECVCERHVGPCGQAVNET